MKFSLFNSTVGFSSGYSLVMSTGPPPVCSSRAPWKYWSSLSDFSSDFCFVQSPFVFFLADFFFIFFWWYFNEFCSRKLLVDYDSLLTLFARLGHLAMLCYWQTLTECARLAFMNETKTRFSVVCKRGYGKSLATRSKIWEHDCFVALFVYSHSILSDYYRARCNRYVVEKKCFTGNFLFLFLAPLRLFFSLKFFLLFSLSLKSISRLQGQRRFISCRSWTARASG